MISTLISHALPSSAHNGRAAPTVLRGLCAAALGIGLAGSAAATTIKEVSLKDRIVRADLIADLTVTDINTRMSTVVGPEDAALPHTFVTYRINSLIKGDAAGAESITLRFLGGNDDQGRHLRVHGIPDFRVGERDILFIQGNGAKMCPLVGWEKSRLRIVEDQIYTQGGQEIWVSPKDELLLGEARLDLSALPYRPTAVSNREGESPRFQPPAGAIRPDRAGFEAVLSEFVHRAYAMGLKAPTTSKSLDAEMAFRVRGLRADPAPAIPADEKSSLFAGEHDQREAELIRRGNHDH